jgi:hypothetical protein
MSEVTEMEARKGLATLDRSWFKYYTDQLNQRENHSWLEVCKILKKFYDAVSIVNQKWTSEDTTNAYLNAYYGF